MTVYSENGGVFTPTVCVSAVWYYFIQFSVHSSLILCHSFTADMKYQ